MAMNTEFIELFRAASLVNGGATTFSKEFTLGEGWVRLHMRFNIALTKSGGSSANSEGELRYIKGIVFRTDKGEIICNNVPGRFMYRLSQIKMGTAPVKTAIAATTATYIVPIDIWFSDPFRLHPSEAHATILDTSRYGTVTMQVSLGTVSDLLGTVSGDTVATTLDCYVERFKGLLPESMKPKAYVQYGFMPPQIPTTQTFVDLEKANNLAYKRLGIFSTTGSSAGVPFDGAMDNTVISDLDVEATEKFVQQNIIDDVLRRQNQIDYQLEAIPAGQHFVSMVDKSRSLRTMFRSGGQSRFRVNWRNQGSLPATPQVTVGYEGVRPLSKSSIA